MAMASGSDAAAQASQLVLLESDFARMPDVVLEGRQVVNNLHALRQPVSGNKIFFPS